jgi:hypothetical protein
MRQNSSLDGPSESHMAAVGGMWRPAGYRARPARTPDDFLGRSSDRRLKIRRPAARTGCPSPSRGVAAAGRSCDPETATERER